MKLWIRALLAAAVLSGAASAQRIGDLPPALLWDELKGNCPASLDWASLRGKVVVLSIKQDFPDGIADWKRLTEAPEDQPAAFLLVFSGSEFLLDQALEQASYTGCVLFDEKAANGANFGFGLHEDRIVLVDEHGFMAETPRFSASSQPAVVDPEPSSTVHISLAPALERRVLGTTLGKPGQYIARNYPLNVIIRDLWDVPMTRISFPEALDNKSYDVLANMQLDDPALGRRLVQEAIQRHFGLRIEKETRSMRVYALTADRNLSTRLQPAKEGEAESSGGGEGFVSGTAEEMESIATLLEEGLGAPVIDQTGLTGRYDYFVSRKLQGPESTFDIARQLGLALKETEQPIEMLTVQKLW